MSWRACCWLSFFLTWLVKSIFVCFLFEHPIPIDIVDISVHIRCNGCILNYWHGHGHWPTGGIKAVFGDLYYLGASLCIIIFYKYLMRQYKLMITASMAETKSGKQRRDFYAISDQLPST